MTPITPTLADLRRSLRADGMPPPGAELTLDLQTEPRPACSCAEPIVKDPADPAERSWVCVACGERAYLPDWLLVSRQLCEKVLSGDYDGEPDSTPVEELLDDEAKDRS